MDNFELKCFLKNDNFIYLTSINNNSRIVEKKSQLNILNNNTYRYLL